MKEIYEMKGAGRSIRGIAQELDVSRNTVRRHLKSPEAMRPRPRPRPGPRVDPYAEHIDRRLLVAGPLLQRGVLGVRQLLVGPFRQRPVLVPGRRIRHDPCR